MQLNSGLSQAPVVKGADSQAMSMKVTGKSFSLLIDKLYTHKFDAVVREIAANAIDAMVQAGRGNVPIEITLPSKFSPYLVISDSGTGLSTDDCVKYFGTMFESSKDGENDSIGAYGLGSKSPFTLTDSYNIVSVKDGIESSFQFVRAGHGIPELVLLSVDPTDSPNGTYFKIDVDPSTYDEWADAIKRQLPFFTPRPIVHGYESIFDETVEIIQDEKSHMIIKSEYIHDHFGCFVCKMGGVLYPIHPRQLGDGRIFEVLSETIGEDQSLVVKVDIGDVEVPPARESLEYTEKTKSCLREILAPITHSILETVMKDLAVVQDEVYAAYDPNNVDTIHRIFTLMQNQTLELSRKYKFLKDESVVKSADNLLDGEEGSSLGALLNIRYSQFLEDIKIPEGLYFLSGGSSSTPTIIAPAQLDTLYTPYKEFIDSDFYTPIRYGFTHDIRFPYASVKSVTMLKNSTTGIEEPHTRLAVSPLWLIGESVKTDWETGRVTVKGFEPLVVKTVRSGSSLYSSNGRVYVLFNDIGNRQHILKNFFLNMVRTGEAIPSHANYKPYKIIVIDRAHSPAQFPVFDDEFTLLERLIRYQYSAHNSSNLIFVKGSDVKLVPKAERKKVVITSVSGMRRLSGYYLNEHNLEKIKREDGDVELTHNHVYAFYSGDNIYRDSELTQSVTARQLSALRLIHGNRNLVFLSQKIGLKYASQLKELGAMSIGEAIDKIEYVKASELTKGQKSEFAKLMTLEITRRLSDTTSNSSIFRDRLRVTTRLNKKFFNDQRPDLRALFAFEFSLSHNLQRYDSKPTYLYYWGVLSIALSTEPEMELVRRNIMHGVIKGLKRDIGKYFSERDALEFGISVTRSMHDLYVKEFMKKISAVGNIGLDVFTGAIDKISGNIMAVLKESREKCPEKPEKVLLNGHRIPV